MYTYNNFRPISRRLTERPKKNQPDGRRTEGTWSHRLLRLWRWRQ